MAHDYLWLAALPAGSTRVGVVCNLAELGEFAEGQTLGAEALRIAEAAERPFSLTQVLGLEQLTPRSLVQKPCRVFRQ
jgi:hypothetical protein